MAVNKYLEFRVFNLVLCFSCLAIIACAEIRQDKHLSDWNDIDDWWNKYQTTQDPSDWDDSDDWWNKYQTTQDPSDWDDSDDWWNKYQTTQDPSDWIRWDWTVPPPEDDTFDYLLKKRQDNSGIYFVVFFGVLIFVLLAAFCGFLKYFCDMSRRNSRNTNYDRLTANDSRPGTPSQRSSVPTISRNFERPHIILEFSNPVSDSSYLVLAPDPPPRYDEVVIGDLSGEGNFQEVQPAIPDTPPPQYEENNPPRY